MNNYPRALINSSRIFRLRLIVTLLCQIASHCIIGDYIARADYHIANMNTAAFDAIDACER